MSEDSGQIGGIPREIHGYRIQRVIGSGGMATVYAAMQKQPRRVVALKVMRSDMTSAHARRRFQREVEILGQLSHPNIASVFDAGTFETDEGERPFFVMEYVEGATDILAHVAKSLPSIDDRIRLFITVCAAIEHGHRQRVIHRDIKPSNILISRQGKPKIIDFGVARAIESDAAHQTMTEDGRLVGTIQYMAPEQVTGTTMDLTPSCDVYALGAVLYRMLTAQPVHDLEHLPLLTAAQKIREDPILPPSRHQPALRGDLETIMLKALEKDPQRRYASAGSLGRDLIRYLGQQPIHARRASVIYRARLFAKRQRTVLLAVSVAAFVMAVAIGIVAWDRLSGNESARRVKLPDEAPSTSVPAPAPARSTNDRVAATPTAPFALEGGSGQASVLLYDAVNGQFIAGYLDGSLAVWSLADRTRRLQMTDHDERVEYLAVSGDGAYIATAPPTSQVVLVRADDGSLVHRRGLSSRIRAVALGPSGGTFVFSSDDLTIRAVSLDGVERTYRGSHGAALSLAWRPDGEWLAAGTERGAVYVWSRDGSRIERFELDEERPIVAVTFNADGSALIAIDDDGDGHRWPITNDELLGPTTFTLGRERPVRTRIDASRRFVIAELNASIDIFDLESMSMRHRGVAIGRDGAYALHPSGEWIARSYDDGVIEIEPITR